MGSNRRAMLVAIAIALASSVALAEPTPAEKETARRLMDQGKAALAHNDMEGAVAAYTKAAELVHLPSTLVALARAHLAAGHLVEARDAALEAARIPEKEGEASLQAAARTSAREMEQQLKPRIPTVLVKLEHPQNAALTLDGRPIQLALIESPIAVNPGHHELVARLPSGTSTGAPFDAREGQVANVAIDLPLEAPVVAHEAQPIGGGIALTPPPRPGSGAKVLLGVGVAFVGLGGATSAIFGAMTFSAAGIVKASCTGDRCAPSVAGTLSDARTFALVSDVGLVVMGAGAIVAITALAIWPRKPSAIALDVGPTGAMFTARFQ